MNASTHTLDTAEALSFLRFWLQVTETPCSTLISIQPDGDTAAATFTVADLDRAAAWIAEQQQAGRGIYFQANETHPGTTRKPSKAGILAALCRFADIDPTDGAPFPDERARLARLADYLRTIELPPTAIIDSGNGLQPIWATVREPTSPDVVQRVEAETRIIEQALGAGGTHNIDRLLRLPGTLNFPNKVKLAKGRGVSRARLIFSVANLLSAADAARLAPTLMASLADSDLVVHKPKAAKARGAAVDVAVLALRDALAAAGADQVSDITHLPEALQHRLQKALATRNPLRNRWAGLVDDLAERGLDASRSGADMSVAAMAKAASFSDVEAGLILCAFPHGKANGDDWPDTRLRLRHVARAVLNSHKPAQRADGNVDPVAAVIADFNERYMVVNEAGRAVIYIPTYDPILNRRHFVRITFEDFKRLYLNRRIRVGEDDKGRPIIKRAADVWLNHADRRQYIGGVVFDPSGRHMRADTLNLWQRFAVQPRPGDWSLMKDHIRSIVCLNDEGRFQYVMGWMARLVQRPAEQGHTAIVMKGGEGTGKGIVARALLKIMGQHGLAISNAKHLVGNFNGHLRDAVLLFADEAFFAGDRAHVGVLKSIITEPYLTIEAKHQNAVQVSNFLHVMMASNDDWVVPASLDSRRFLVLNVSEAKKGDYNHFQAIDDQMESSGYAAMLHELLNRDISTFNVRNVPVTDGLHEQRKLSLPTAEAWWMDCLQRGYVFRSKLGLEDEFARWHDELSTELLYASYTEYAQQHRERHPLARETFGKLMVRLGAKAKRLNKAAVGEHMVDVQNQYGSTNRKTVVRLDPRPPGYTVGTLADARIAFCTATGLTVTWDDEIADADRETP